MQYINPIELLGLSDVEGSEVISNDVIKKAKRKLFAEIELSDDGHYEYHGISLTKGECESAVEQLADETKKAFYWYLASEEELNEFLISGYDGEYYTVTIEREDLPNPEHFIRFISPFFTPKLDKALLQAFKNEDEVDLEALLDTSFFVAPSDVNAGYRSLSSYLQSRITEIADIQSDIKNELSDYDEDDIHEVVDLVREYFPVELLNLLPSYFQSQVLQIAKEINFLSVAIWEAMDAPQVCEDLAEHLLSLDISGLDKPIFEKNYEIFKEKNQALKEQAKYAPILKKYARYIIQTREKVEAVKNKTLYPAALLEWVDTAVSIVEVNQLPQKLEEIKSQFALSLRILSAAVWNTHSNIEVALALIQKAEAVTGVSAETRQNIQEAKNKLVEITEKRKASSTRTNVRNHAQNKNELYPNSLSKLISTRPVRKKRNVWQALSLTIEDFFIWVGNGILELLIKLGLATLGIFLFTKSCDSCSPHIPYSSSSDSNAETQAISSIEPVLKAPKDIVTPPSSTGLGVKSTPTYPIKESKYKGNQLKSGASPLNGCFGKSRSGGRAYITFDNSNSTDAIVCLVNYNTEKTIRNEYIRAGADYTMRNIPTGTYYLKVYYGNDWNPTKENFCGTKGAFESDVHFSKSDNIGDLIEIENSDYSYTTGHITLYSVPNGNMSTERMAESEFFNQ